MNSTPESIPAKEYLLFFLLQRRQQTQLCKEKERMISSSCFYYYLMEIKSAQLKKLCSSVSISLDGDI